MMISKMRHKGAALAAFLAAGTMLAPTAAQSQTLFDFLFQNAPRGRPIERVRPADRFIQRDEYRRQQVARQSEPQPVVSGPSYKTYRADALVRVDFSPVSDPVTTGSVDADADSFSSDVWQPRFSRDRAFLADIDMSALEDVGKAVAAHYAGADRYHWVDEDGMTERAGEVLAVLAEAERFGLSSTDYAVQPLRLAGTAEERARDAMRFEMELSTKALTYVLDATRGRIDPNRISGYHDFKRKTVDLEAALNVLVRTSDVAGYLERRNPTHSKFVALREELARLRAESVNKERIDIAADTFVRPGGQSDELPDIVAAMRSRGSDALKTDYALVFADYDGSNRYEGQLVDLLKAFQTENGLSDDGIVGPNTIMALSGFSNADKIEKVTLAMERLRWLNRDLGARHVMINAPAFRAAYTEDGREKLAMRVVVGTKANQTYFFQDRIETVEFNPYWGVPRSIIVNEMLPKLRQDPSYLDRQGYEVTTRSGTQIASRAVDWYSVGANVPYNVRQPPGPRNALGELKILFPNAHAIYMHDTPAKELFGRDTRAYSHGCVRLEDPRAMAAAVLGTTKEAIGREIAGGRNHGVEVKSEIPVYVAYFTAWPDKDGAVEYFNDVYERDMYMSRAIEATRQARHVES